MLHILDVSVHGLVGDWSILRRKNDFCQSTVAENMDLSPSRGQRGTVPFSRRSTTFRR